MEKTLLVGDHDFVNKFIFGPTVFDWERAILPVKEISRGDVIVFRYPENPVQDFVKRAVGMPGDSLSIRDKEVWVDGSPVRVATAWHSDPNVYSSSNTDIPDLIVRDNYDGLLIAKDHYFAMGDNRDNSLDSRFALPAGVGMLPAENLIGRADRIIFSSAGASMLYFWTWRSDRFFKAVH